MLDRVVSFSVRPKDRDNHILVATLKMHSIRTGIKFNHIVLEGLKLYIEKWEAEHGEVLRRAKD